MKKNYKDFNGNDSSIIALEGASRFKINVLIQKVKNGSNMAIEFKLPDDFNSHIKDELKIKLNQKKRKLQN